MTSWIHTARKQKSEEGPKLRNYFLSPDNGEFVSYYLSLFNAHVFSNANNRSLYVYDKSNPISVSYSLLKDAFLNVPNINYVSEMMTGVTILNGRSDPRYSGLMPRLSKDVLRQTAAELLKWSPSILEKVNTTLTERKLPSTFDVGVHIRSRNRFDAFRAPVIAIYVSAVEDVCRRLKRDDLTVFVLAESPTDFVEFQRLAPPTWKLFQVQPNIGTIRGSNVGTYNRQNSAVKMNAYIEHVTELYCMQNCTNIVGTLSNDIGRFLYLTATDPTAFRSLDVQVYSS